MARDREAWELAGKLAAAAILFAVLALLAIVAVKQRAPQPMLPLAEARTKPQAVMCVAPWRWSHSCDGEDCRNRKPGSVA